MERREKVALAPDAKYGDTNLSSGAIPDVAGNVAPNARQTLLSADVHARVSQASDI